LFHTTSIGLAKKMDEYVPDMIPMVRASANSFNAVVPSTRRSITGNKVVMDVFIDL